VNLRGSIYKEIINEIIRWNKVLVGAKLDAYGLPI